MRLRKGQIPFFEPVRGLGRGLRQCTPVAGLSALLLACSNPEAPSRVAYVPGFYGGAVADEPTAATVGRNVLSAGGSAADAAVAVYFALAVTKPASAGLGAVGACLTYEPAAKEVRAIDFTSAPAGSGTVAVPGAVRGMYALHAAMGRQPWSQLLVPAETLARFGAPATRSFRRDLEAWPEAVRDEEFGQRVRGAGGGFVGEGERVVQPELAEFIGEIRTRGPATFYDGPLGRRFADAVARLGERLDLAEMRAQAPRVVDPLVRPAGDGEAHFVPSELSAGPYQAALWTEISRGGSSAARTIEFGDAGSSFVVADESGNAVACGFTLNRPFGIGRTAPGTGIFPAAPPSGAVSGALSPVIVANANTDILVLAAAGSGGDAPRDIVQTGVRATVDGEVVDRQSGGSANVISCPRGLPDRPDSCTIAVDPSGGYAATAIPRRRER